MSYRIRGLTLLELLISISLLSVIILTVANIEIFSRFHLMDSNRRVKLQNEVSFALEHMNQQFGLAIGNENVDGANSVVRVFNLLANQRRVRTFIDFNEDAHRSNVGIWPWNDRRVGYRFTAGVGGPTRRYQIWHCPYCINNNCTACIPGWWNAANRISRNIAAFNVVKSGGATLNRNFINVQITACDNPATGIPPDGTSDNPCVTMNTDIKMHSVSAN